jgi:hypothetical protein
LAGGGGVCVAQADRTNRKAALNASLMETVVMGRILSGDLAFIGISLFISIVI